MIPLIISFILFILYQLSRIARSGEIITKWINENDNRYNMYSFDHIVKSNKKNWYGLRYPNEKHYE